MLLEGWSDCPTLSSAKNEAALRSDSLNLLLAARNIIDVSLLELVRKKEKTEKRKKKVPKSAEVSF